MPKLLNSKAAIGQIIAGAGGRVPLRDAPRLAAEYGGRAADWGKITSSNFKAADGVSFETHAYLKTKFQ